MQPGASAGTRAGADGSPLVYTQELRPRSNGAGSQPFQILETHDPKTGEVWEFEWDGKQQGIIPRRYTITDHQNARLDRYAMKWSLDRLLPGSRQTRCHRWRIPGRDVELKLSLEHQKSFVAGCECCGSVWGCPLCAPKITERRRLEVSEAMSRAKEMGLQVLLLTLTVPHGLGDDVRVVLDQMKQAWRKGSTSRAGKTMRKMIGLKGTIRVLEVTYGENGWHPHFHVMLFVDSSWSPDVIQRLWYPIWLDGCRKSGLADPSKAHGCRVDDGSRAARYLTKWGLDSELTKGHLKRGKTSVNPWDLLRVYTFGLDDRRISSDLRDVMTGLGIDREKAGKLWQVFFFAFKGARQLYWSNGLRALLGLTKEKTDQELAEEEMDPVAAILAVLNAYWPLIVKTKLLPDLLNLAEDSPGLIPDFLFALKNANYKKKRRKNGTENHTYLVSKRPRC